MIDRHFNLLFVDSEADQVRMVNRYLNHHGFTVSSRSAAELIVDDGDVAVVLAPSDGSPANGRAALYRPTPWGTPIVAAEPLALHRSGEEQHNGELDAIRFQVINARAMAEIDCRTGLPNSLGMKQRLDHEISRSCRNGTGLMALLVVFSPSESRRLSAAMEDAARILEETLRAADTIGRVSDAEFLVLLPDTRRAEGYEVVKKLYNALADLPGSAIVTAMGVPPAASSVDDLLGRLRDKRFTMRRLRKASAALVRRGIGGADLVAVVAEDLVARAQPIVDLINNWEVAQEFLVRGPLGPLSHPYELLGACEHPDAAKSIDLRCLEFCLGIASASEFIGRYHLNLFPSTLIAAPHRVVDLMASFPENIAQRCVIELSEQLLVGDASGLVDGVEMLRALGVGIAIDEFSFNRNGMEMLVLLRPDYVKLTSALCRGAATDAGKREMVRRIHRIISGSGAQIVAVGVESDEDANALRSNGVTLGQGYLWGEPEPV